MLAVRVPAPVAVRAGALLEVVAEGRLVLQRGHLQLRLAVRERAGAALEALVWKRLL